MVKTYHLESFSDKFKIKGGVRQIFSDKFLQRIPAGHKACRGITKVAAESNAVAQSPNGGGRIPLAGGDGGPAGGAGMQARSKCSRSV